MKVACCFTGSNPIPQKYKEYLTQFEDVQYFRCDSQSFAKTLEILSLEKQAAELRTKKYFDMCMFINTDVTDVLHELPKLDKIQQNTIYTICEYIEDNKLFGLFWQFQIHEHLFLCDSKTFNILGTYPKYFSMTETQYRVPAETFFYSFIQNMGITNNSIENINSDWEKMPKSWYNYG